ELDIAAADLRAAAKPEDGRLAVSVAGYDLALRLPDSRDLAVCAAADLAAAEAILLRRCVVAASRGGLWVAADDLPATAVEAVARRLSEADPQTDLRLALACAGCGHQWRVPFDIVPFRGPSSTPGPIGRCRKSTSSLPPMAGANATFSGLV